MVAVDGVAKSIRLVAFPRRSVALLNPNLLCPHRFLLGLPFRLCVDALTRGISCGTVMATAHCGREDIESVTCVTVFLPRIHASVRSYYSRVTVHVCCPNTIHRCDIDTYEHISLTNDILFHQQYWQLVIVS